MSCSAAGGSTRWSRSLCCPSPASASGRSSTAVPRGDAARHRRRGTGRHRPLRVADAAGAAAAHPRRQPAGRRGRRCCWGRSRPRRRIAITALAIGAAATALALALLLRLRDRGMSDAGLLLPLAIGLPLLGAVLAPLLPGRFAAPLRHPGLPARQPAPRWRSSLRSTVPARRCWQPIGGLLLRADGLAAAMLGASALVTGAVGLYARAEYGNSRGFWGLLLGVWAAMALVLLGTDLFSLAIALELLTFAAVAAGLPRRQAGHRRGRAALPAVRACSARCSILLGCALLLGGYGTLDIAGCWPGRRGRSRRPAGRRADDRRAAGQDRALPAASLAAAGAWRRAAGGQRRAVRRWW